MAAVETETVPSEWCGTGDGVGVWQQWKQTVPSEWCGTDDGVGVWQQWEQKPSLQSGVR